MRARAAVHEPTVADMTASGTGVGAGVGASVNGADALGHALHVTGHICAASDAYAACVHPSPSPAIAQLLTIPPLRANI